MTKNTPKQVEWLFPLLDNRPRPGESAPWESIPHTGMSALRRRPESWAGAAGRWARRAGAELLPLSRLGAHAAGAQAGNVAGAQMGGWGCGVT